MEKFYFRGIAIEQYFFKNANVNRGRKSNKTK